MQPSDDELVYRIGDHDEEAFELLFKRYKSMVYRYSRYLTLNNADAEDLFQDTWLRVAKCLPPSGTIENFQAWLCSITTNLHRDLLRKKSRRILFRDKPPASEAENKMYENVVAEGGNPFPATEARVEIQRAIASLSYRQRRVFVLKEIEGFKLAEIGRALRMPVGTVKSLLHRAVKNMRDRLCDLSING